MSALRTCDLTLLKKVIKTKIIMLVHLGFHLNCCFSTSFLSVWVSNRHGSAFYQVISAIQAVVCISTQGVPRVFILERFRNYLKIFWKIEIFCERIEMPRRGEEERSFENRRVPKWHISSICIKMGIKPKSGAIPS